MRTFLLGLATVSGLLGGPGAAQAFADEAPAAGDATEARLQALEELIRQQGEEIRRLQGELRRPGAPAPAPSPHPAPALAPAPAGPALGASAAVPASGAPARGFAGGPGSVDARATLAATPAGGVTWGGYGTLEWIAPSDADSHFDLHRLVLTFDAPITRCVDFQGEVEFEHGGSSDELDGEVVVEQAAITFRLADWIQPKAGALLVPFGRTNRYHDDPIHDFTLRPWTGRFLVPTGWGVPGVGVEGSAPLGCHTFSYDVVVNNGVKDGFSASTGIRPARQEWQEDNNENKQVFGRAAMAWRVPGLARLETGLSGTFGRYDDAGQNDLTGFGADLLLRWGPLEVTGEYLRYDLERDAADPADAVEGLWGLWAQAAWHFFPPFLRCSRGCLVEDTSHFTLAVRYMETDLDDRVHGATGRDDQTSWGVALNYRLTERTVIRVDHTWFDAVSEPDTRELTLSLSTYF